LEEIQAAHQHIFSSQLEADVASRYSRWGGIPQYVLQLTDESLQAWLMVAVNKFSLSNVTWGLADLSTASDFNQMLFHLTVDAGYCQGPVVFASDWVQGQVITRCLQAGPREVRAFLAGGSWGEPNVVAFRGRLWERYAHVALQRGGRFSCRDLQDPEARPFEIEIEPEPCSSSVDLSDVQDSSTPLSGCIGGWGRSKNLPATYAVVQPGQPFQITLSGNRRINARWLVDLVREMQAKEQDMQLFFVAPPDEFRSYTKQTLERIRGDLAAESVARVVKQFVLKVDL